MRLCAAYLSQAVIHEIDHSADNDQREFLMECAKRLGTFSCRINGLPESGSNSIASVLVNLMERGNPTSTSPYVEHILSLRLGLTELSDRKDQIQYRFTAAARTHPAFQNSLERSLVPIVSDTNENPEPDYGIQWEQSEREFLLTTLEKAVGRTSATVLQQLAEPQRPFETMLEPAQRAAFEKEKRRVDFAFDLPDNGKSKRFVIEIDGAQYHSEKIDEKRDAALRHSGWQVVRIPTTELDHLPENHIQQLNLILSHKYALLAQQNVHQPYLSDTFIRKLFQLVLVPLGVARIQRTLLEFVLRGVLSWDAEQWRIAIYEPDLSCGWLAIADFIDFASTLCRLAGQSHFPQIDLTIIRKSGEELELTKPPETLPFSCHVIDEREATALSPVDVLIAHSIMARFGWLGLPDEITRLAENETIAVLRSTQSCAEPPVILCDQPILYQDETLDDNDLRYMVQYVFRKQDFREGQLRIIRRALMRQDVIGLLPTGGGKSICYQLATLLQPGITLVVDPIKSLMHDQYDNLLRAGIDRTTYINSTLTTEERKQRQIEMAQRRYQFVFISPERLSIEDFQQHLHVMRAANVFIYGVVDEAHCVSEWGHEFRTAYLRLADNLRKWLASENHRLTILALTGTASYDVLADIQRDLNIDTEEAIVQPDSLERRELEFHVIPVDVRGKISHIQDEKKQKEIVGYAKQHRLVTLMADLSGYFGDTPFPDADFKALNGEETFSGLVFCPYARRGLPLGVEPVRNRLVKDFAELEAISDFYASTNDDLANQELDQRLRKVQLKFKQDKLALLVATKAFGMGIDKPNIRYTIHVNIPSSVESFYQEAGRAGRDRQPARCFILLAQGDGWQDKSINDYFHGIAFKGIDKDRAALRCILHGEGTSLYEHLQRLKLNEKTSLALPFEDKAVNRDEQDTAKAVYRLSIIGVISDYTVDYRNKLYNLTVCKLAEEGYIRALQQYIARYMSPADAAAVPEEVLRRTEATVTEKCLSYLLEFVYNKIAAKRREAMEVMQSAAEAGINDKAAFAERINNYFNSSFLPELRKFRQEYSIETVWSFIDQIEKAEIDRIDRAKHLRGACDRLLPENPDNAAFYLLRAYVGLVLSTTAREIERDFQSGWNLFGERMSRIEIGRHMTRYYRHVCVMNPVEGAIELQQLMLQWHAAWLKEFNMQHFEGAFSDE